MVLIVKRGMVPPTPHTEFYVTPGVLALEEIHGSYGFSGAWSRKIHVRSYPTEQVRPPGRGDFSLEPEFPEQADILQPYHIWTGRVPFENDAIRGRKPIVHGPRTSISVSKPVEDMPKDAFFRNGERHEMYFCQEGEGRIRSEYGDLRFRKDVYVSIPKGTTYRIELDTTRAWFLIVESLYPITFAPQYFNRSGQATLMSPVVETEVEAPDLLPYVDERGEFPVDVKHSNGKITRITMGHHPFDLVGWEGALYPFVFDIHNHHGIAREIHTAPPVHQTFQSGNVPNNGFSLCSFVPVMSGWHPKEVPAPYAHFNADSDELMFFCNMAYEARKGVIEEGSFTFHPGATPHSPQGKAAEKSMADRGKVSPRLAVMLDTYFESMRITNWGWQFRDADYALSWSEQHLTEAAAKGPGWVSPSE
jgi:homogentisate 1,2-dioxygenase